MTWTPFDKPAAVREECRGVRDPSRLFAIFRDSRLITATPRCGPWLRAPSRRTDQACVLETPDVGLQGPGARSSSGGFLAASLAHEKPGASRGRAIALAGAARLVGDRHLQETGFQKRPNHRVVSSWSRSPRRTSTADWFSQRRRAWARSRSRASYRSCGMTEVVVWTR